MFEAYEERKGKMEKAERGRNEGVEWKNSPKYMSVINQSCSQLLEGVSLGDIIRASLWDFEVAKAQGNTPSK